MDFNRLPLDLNGMLAGMRRWVACESPSWDGQAVSRMVALAGEDLRQAGAQVRTIPGHDGYGDCVFGDFAPQDTTPGILVLGHLDTVHPLGSLDGEIPWREAEGHCHGPGLFDMKSGNIMALEALRQLRAARHHPKLPVRFLFTSDEESGSPSTRALIEETARHQKCVLVPEGAQPNDTLVSGRFPSCRLRLWTYGKPSHALMQREIGRSSLATMAKIILGIEGLNGGDTAYTVTYVQAGLTVATVPMESYAELVCTTRSSEGLEAAIAAVRQVATNVPDCDFRLTVKTARPLWVRSAADVALCTHAQALGRELGLELGSEVTFGGSDGNFTGALGIPTLDGLGAVGFDAHQLTERIDVASIVPRSRLMAGLLATLE